MTNELISIYRDHPMADGDVVVLVPEHQLATEIEGLADHWDAQLCRNLARLLQELEASEVEIAVARAHGHLLDSDHSLLGDLVEELAGTGVVVRPLVALPAALDLAV